MQKKNIKTIYNIPDDTSIFINMPQNLTVFENIAPMVYNVLWSHFDRVGFVMGQQNNSDFKLKVKIIKLENVERFVSQDVLPYALKVNITLECNLLDSSGNIITSKTFDFFKWVSRPKDPVRNWTYLRVQYEELLERAIPRIDQYLRPFVIKEK